VRETGDGNASGVFIICWNFRKYQEILDAYRKAKGDWSGYESDFLALLSSRKVEENNNKS
jgi:hypothetical protein